MEGTLAELANDRLKISIRKASYERGSSSKSSLSVATLRNEALNLKLEKAGTKDVLLRRLQMYYEKQIAEGGDYDTEMSERVNEAIQRSEMLLTQRSKDLGIVKKL